MTFPLLAVAAERGFLAAATASRSQAVGNSTLALLPQLGIVCTQAWTNRELKPWAMIALSRGAEAEDLVQALPDRDPDRPLEILLTMLESRLRLEHPGRDDALGTVDPAPPSVLPQGHS
ncbi:DUF1028 domain-containing protein [Brachybacterium squillarum]|uniref:DUF1028 domain-containing protein n=1 Tax=Brachybacterium squillarum TaxID=661979 RepID=UPI000262965F|nr:DUF1028 domain-containing protein [Brachybacterium squillarum]